VYAEGELQALVESVPGVKVLDQYYDTGNWCVVLEKLA
jgi:alkylated DNA repair protein alkB homolog 8